MKLTVFFIIFLLTKWSNHSTLALYKICVKPSPYVGSSTPVSSGCKQSLEWSILLKNISKYFTSYTKLLFQSGVYNLSTHLLIENVTHLVITEAYTFKPGSTLTIQCVANNSALHPFVSVSNSTHVTIQNIKLNNCGINIQNYVLNNNQRLLRESAAILLYNVSSMLIINVSIQNNCGYSIIV